MRAEYAILTLDGKRLSVDLRRTPFDLQRFLAITIERGMPHATWANNEWNAE